MWIILLRLGIVVADNVSPSNLFMIPRYPSNMEKKINSQNLQTTELTDYNLNILNDSGWIGNADNKKKDYVIWKR